jgi:hypothetical protein
MSDSHELYSSCGISGESQTNGNITFSCETVPDKDLILNLLVLNIESIDLTS